MLWHGSASNFELKNDSESKFKLIKAIWHLTNYEREQLPIYLSCLKWHSSHSQIWQIIRSKDFITDIDTVILAFVTRILLPEKTIFVPFIIYLFLKYFDSNCVFVVTYVKLERDEWLPWPIPLQLRTKFYEHKYEVTPGHSHI